MARVNIPLTIKRPNVDELVNISFVANAAGNTNVIPFRYPFADISNYTALKNAGYFRHATTTVSSELGGSSTTNTASKLGFQLPHPEKLVLLVKVVTAITTKKIITITVAGSAKYKIPNKVFVITADVTGKQAVSAGDILELDLFDFGLLLDSAGEITITADGDASEHADDDHVAFALVARMG